MMTRERTGDVSTLTSLFGSQAMIATYHIYFMSVPVKKRTYFDLAARAVTREQAGERSGRVR